jgi:transposase
VPPLTDRERGILMRWIREETTLPALRRRARVILLSSHGISAYTISLLIPMGRNNVSFWIRRFKMQGPEGLHDRPRPGRPRRRSPQSDDAASG